MRTLVLSVCVGLYLCACDGSTDRSEEEVETRDGGANRSDSSVVEGDEDGGNMSPQEPSDGGRSELDGGSASSDGGSRDSGARDGGQADAGTRDGGARDAGGQPDAGASTPDSGGAPSGRPMFVAAGYQSGIAISTDLGRSWQTVREPMGPFADNEFVLSGCAFGEGTFAVAGFDIFTSTNGTSWTERTNPTTQWLGNLNFGQGRFVGTGGYGTALWSDDGVMWRKGTMLGDSAYDTGAFGNGVFMTTSREGVWWRSTDGETWAMNSPQPSTAGIGDTSKIVWCGDSFAFEGSCQTRVQTGQVAFGEGVWIRVRHEKSAERLENGQWVSVDLKFNANCVAFGYVP